MNGVKMLVYNLSRHSRSLHFMKLNQYMPDYLLVIEYISIH
jgi:hypothetical protein